MARGDFQERRDGSEQREERAPRSALAGYGFFPAIPACGQSSQERLGVLGRVSEGAAPSAGGAALRRDRLRQLQAVPATPSPLCQPKPVQHPVFALAAPDSLAPYLASAYRARRHAARPWDVHPPAAQRKPPYPSLNPVPSFYIVEPIPRPLLHVGCANLVVHSQTLCHRLASIRFAGVGSFVGECLDISGDEPYSAIYGTP